MTIALRTAVVALGAALVAGPLAASADPAIAPIRHLVYAFTYTNTTDLTVHSSGVSGQSNDPGQSAPVSGMKDYRNGSTDRGTITVDILRVQPDSGLVVSISEQARDSRSALPATCVVYGNTNLICDPDKRINTEEVSLLRTLGSNFIDASQIDAKNHWQVSSSAPRMSNVADYSIDKNEAGLLHIGVQRVLHQEGVGSFTTTTDGIITYDSARAVPLSIVEDDLTRAQQTMGTYSTDHAQTSLSLTEDSAKKPGHLLARLEADRSERTFALLWTQLFPDCIPMSRLGAMPSSLLRRRRNGSRCR